MAGIPAVGSPAFAGIENGLELTSNRREETKPSKNAGMRGGRADDERRPLVFGRAKKNNPRTRPLRLSGPGRCGGERYREFLD